MLDERIRKFLEEAGPVFYVTPAATRAVGLEGVLPDYHVICTERYAGAELFQEAGAKFFYLPKYYRNAGKILSDPEAVNYIKSNSGGRKANILTFKPSPMIEMACKKNGFRYLGNDWRINREWEDKVKFAEITAALGIPNAHSRITRITRENLKELEGSLDFSDGRKYVVQFSRGYSGNSTFIAKDKDSFSSILRNNIGRKAKIADFVEGDTYTFDVCAGNFGILMSQPIFQITGFAEFNRNSLGTCGNDFAFGKAMDGKMREEVYANMRKVTERLMAIGYRGILGFDFVVGADGAHIIEVNPRLIGSIPILTKLQLREKEIPFLLLHILSFLGFDFGGMEIPQPRRDLVFSQLILRNVSDKPLRVVSAIPSGIYRMRDGAPEFLRGAYFFDDGLAGGEFFLECAPEGSVIDPDMEYANLQANYGIMKERSGLKEEIAKIKDGILNSIILS